MEIMEIVAYCLGVFAIIVVIAFCIAWACMQEEQFAEIDEQIREIKEKRKSESLLQNPLQFLCCEGFSLSKIYTFNI